MKILIDGVIFSRQHAGGISRYWYHLLVAMLYQNNRDKLYVVYERNRNLFLNNISKADSKYNLKLLPQFLTKPYRFVYGNKWEFRDKLMGLYSKIVRPDIFHSTYFNSCTNNSLKKVVTLHDLIYELFPNTFETKVRLNVSDQHQRILQEVDGVIAVSETTLKDGIRIYPFLVEKPSVVIHHGVDKSIFYRSPEKGKMFRETYRIEKPFLLFVGERRGYKNFTLFLQAYHYSALKSVYDIVVVGGQQHLNEEELSLVEQFGIQHHIRKCQNISDDDLAGAYNAAEALIYPSQYEGFGLPAVEALACGCPVVVADTPIFREIVGQHGHYFQLGTLDSFIEVLNSLESMPSSDEERNRMIRWTEQFDWNISAKKTLDFYHYVLGQTH